MTTCAASSSAPPLLRMVAGVGYRLERQKAAG